MNTSESIYIPKRTKKVVVPVDVTPEGIEIVPVVPAKVNKTVWPKDNDEALQAKFGSVADYHYTDCGHPNKSWESSFLQKLDLPFPMRLAWNKSVLVRQIVCNREIYASLDNCLQGIWNLYGKNLDNVQAARMDLYGGCFNFRTRRGGHRLSLHAWGAAIDLDPENNPHGKKWEEGKGMIPKEVVEIFMREGWKWGGTFSSPDCMHFEATS